MNMYIILINHAILLSYGVWFGYMVVDLTCTHHHRVQGIPERTLGSKVPHLSLVDLALN